MEDEMAMPYYTRAHPNRKSFRQEANSEASIHTPIIILKTELYLSV
jgi:hypothetical protein